MHADHAALPAAASRTAHLIQVNDSQNDAILDDAILDTQ